MSVRISAWAIRTPTPVALLMIALTLAGMVAYARLPIERLPNVEFPIVAVSVTQSGAAPAEIESQITRPVEDALAGIAGLRHISSTVTLGASTTTAEFELGTDMQKATDDVRTAVEQARAILPAGIDPPSTRRVDISAIPIITYAVAAPGMSPTELSWFVDNNVSRALQAQSGVSQVARIAGLSREINVTLDPARLAAFGVTAAQVNAALVATNINDTGARADISGSEQTMRVLGEGSDVAAIAATTMPIATGGYVRLSDMATIDDGAGELRAFARLDGRPCRINAEAMRELASGNKTVKPATIAGVFKIVGAQDVVDYLDHYISSHPYFGSNTFSAADIMMDFVVTYISVLPFDPATYSNLTTWQKKIQARAAYQRAFKVGAPDGLEKFRVKAK